MKVLFDETRKVLGVVPDDTEVVNGHNFVYLPNSLKTKLHKNVQRVEQKQDISGNPLFLSNGKETTEAVTNFVPNPPAITTVEYGRCVGLLESPSEWTVDDVLRAKYSEMAGKKKFWYCGYQYQDVMNKEKSRISGGIFGISICANSAVESIPLTLQSAIKTIEVYLEADADLIVKLISDEETVEAAPSLATGRLAASFTNATDTFAIRIENPEGVDVPIRAFAIFY